MQRMEESSDKKKWVDKGREEIWDPADCMWDPAVSSKIISEEMASLCAIFQGDCEVVVESHPHVIIKIRRYSKVAGKEKNTNDLVHLLVRWLPGYPCRCPELQLTPVRIISETDADRLLSLLYEEAKSYARDGNVMVFHLVKVAEEFLSENFPVDLLHNQFTCRALDFLDLPLTVQKENEHRHCQMVIGIVDRNFDSTWSCFSDEDLPPLEREWDGDCSTGFFCNKKVIGHKVYSGMPSGQNQEIKNEHGTTCCAICAGNYVEASYFGIREGTIRGSVPKSRLALYECGERAIDICVVVFGAVKDKVNVICLPLGPDAEGLEQIKEKCSSSYYIYPLSLGTLVATFKGILCCVCAGNSYGVGEVANYAPWELCVGACNTNFKFASVVELDDGERIEGFSTNLFEKTGLCPLILDEDACSTMQPTIGSKSVGGRPLTVLRRKAKGKIILVDHAISINSAVKAGAKGIIQCVSPRDPICSVSYPLPLALVLKKDYDKILFHMKHSRSQVAKAELFPTDEVLEYEDDFPVLLKFSSKGLSPQELDVMKPDVCAPGQFLVPTKLHPTSAFTEHGKQICQFRLATGTSFSTALVAGIVAHVTSIHPSFSCAAIKSAIMTTAGFMKIEVVEDSLGIGTGVINVHDAVLVALVYDMDPLDYITYLNWHGFEFPKPNVINEELKELAEMAVEAGSLHPRDLNLPSFTATFNEEEPCWRFTRKLKECS